MNGFGKLLLLVLACGGTTRLQATAQIGERLVLGRDTVRIQSEPLEACFNQKGRRTIGGASMDAASPGLVRGCVTTWQLRNDSLFPVQVQTGLFGGHPKLPNLAKEFGSHPVPAPTSKPSMPGSFSTVIAAPSGRPALRLPAGLNRSSCRPVVLKRGIAGQFFSQIALLKAGFNHRCPSMRFYRSSRPECRSGFQFVKFPQLSWRSRVGCLPGPTFAAA